MKLYPNVRASRRAASAAMSASTMSSGATLSSSASLRSRSAASSEMSMVMPGRIARRSRSPEKETDAVTRHTKFPVGMWVRAVHGPLMTGIVVRVHEDQVLDDVLIQLLVRWEDGSESIMLESIVRAV